MRKTYFLVLVMMALFMGSQLRLDKSLAATEPPAEGGVLPDFSLPAPESPEARKYLGLEGKNSFKIPQIEAEVVVVEIFSMYCPHCQKEAPTVNKFYQAVAKESNLGDKVKIIGIGVGNTPYEVNIFKDRYKIPFPLFPDADFSIHQLVGEVMTPYFIVVKINDDGSHKVIYSQLGSFGDPEDFLQEIVKRSRIKDGK